jgi:hypothetical protein
MSTENNSGNNPLGMHPLEPDGPFVLSPQLCTTRRREYFQRGNRILSTYSAIAAYSGKGKEWLDRAISQNPISADTPIRITMDGHVFQSKLRTLQEMFEKAGAQLTNQIFLMIYGNFEAFIADLTQDALDTLGVIDPYQETLSLMISSKWPGKIDRISQRLSVQLRRRDFVQRYENIEMGFLGNPISDPIGFLQCMADLRHRLVHSAGRVDSKLVSDYPRAGLKVGGIIELPFGLPFDIFFFFVPITDLIDEKFSDKFDFTRERVEPESLVDR